MVVFGTSLGPVGPAWTAEPVGVMVQQPDVSQLLFSGGDWILNLGWLLLSLKKRLFFELDRDFFPPSCDLGNYLSK